MSNTDGPQPGVAAWVPDPGGGHQLRWWDGRGYTALVADAGVQGVDPLPPEATRPAPGASTAPTPPTAPTQPWSRPPLTSSSPSAPSWAPGPAGPQPAAPTDGPAAPEGAGGDRRRLLLIGGAVVAVVAVVAVAMATRVGETVLGEDADGTGSFEGAVAADEVGHHDVSVGPTEVLLATVEPAEDVDVVVGLLVDADTAGLLEDLYGGLADPSDAATAFGDVEDGALAQLVEAAGADREVVVLRTDVGFAGDEEAVLLLAGAEVEATLVVAPFGASAGDYTVEVERFDLGVAEDELAGAGGDELLDGVLGSRGVPARVLDLAADLLEVLRELGGP